MWGTASLGKLCRTARQLGYDRLALTDTDNLYGLWPFLEACRREGITPSSVPKSPIRTTACTEPFAWYPMPPVTRTCAGCSPKRHMATGFSLIRALPELADGLVVLTTQADLLETWHRAGMTVHAAMPRKPLAPTHPLRQTARRLQIPLVAVPGSFFLTPEDHGLHCLLRAIDQNTGLDRLTADQKAPADAWLADPETYARRFAICPEAVDHTRRIADRLVFTGPDFGLVMPPWHDDGQRPGLRHPTPGRL